MLRAGYARVVRWLPLRGAVRSRRATRGWRPPRRHEVVEQPPELPSSVDVAIRPHHDDRRPSASRRPQTRRRGSQNEMTIPEIRKANAAQMIPWPGSFFAINSV